MGPGDEVPPVSRARALLLAFLVLLPLASAQSIPFLDARAGTPPRVEVLAPSEGAGLAGDVVFEGAAEDPDSNVADVQFRVDQGAWASVATAARSVRAAPWRQTVDADALTPGAHVVEFRAFDGFSWSVPVAVHVATDFGNAPPAVEVLAPRDGDALAPAATVEVVAHATDADGAVAGVEARVDEGAWARAERLADGTWTVSLPVVPGIRALEVRAVDDEGAAGASRHLHVAVGAVSTPPRLVLTSPVPRAGVTEAGDTLCPRCLLVTGIVAGPAVEVLASVDGGSERPVGPLVPAPDGALFQYRWPTDAFAGVHRFALRAVDADGQSSAPVVVDVALASERTFGVHVAPTVVRTGEPFTARVSSSQPLTRVAWTVLGEGGATGPEVRLVSNRTGLREILVHVEDAAGRTGLGAAAVQVLNRPPLAAVAASHAVAAPGEDVLFDATSTVDLDGEVVAWRFTTSDGRATPWTSEPTTSFSWFRKGRVTVGVEARDDQGAVGRAETHVAVLNSPPFVTVHTDLRHPRVGETVNLTAWISDPDGDPMDVAWELGDGTAAVGTRVAHAYAARGRHTVTVAASDAEGGASVATAHIDVENAPPVPWFTYAPREPRTADVVTFRDATTDADGPVRAWNWSFGDGHSSRERQPFHQYAKDGSYAVRLEVTDDLGAVAAVESVIHVGNALPRANFTWEPAAPTLADDVAIRSRAVDLDGSVVAWRWTVDGEPAGTGESLLHRFRTKGLHDVKLVVEDDRGLLGEVVRTLAVVNALPEVDVPGGLEAVAGTPVLLEASVRDVDGRVAATRWDVDADGVDEYHGTGTAFAWTYAKPGLYQAVFVAVDDDGGVRARSVLVDVRPPWPGDGPPVVGFLDPREDHIVSRVVHVQGLASDDGAVRAVEWQVRDGDRVAWPLDGGWLLARGREQWGADLDTRFLESGPHVLAARAWDGRQWSEVALRRFESLNDPREAPDIGLHILHPAAGGRVSGDVVVQGTSFHPQGVERVAVALDEHPLADAEGATEWAWAFDSRTVTSGAHTLRVRAYLGGELYREERLPFVVNNDPPTLYVPPEQAARPLEGLVAIKGYVALDQEADRVLVRVDGGEAQEVVGTLRWTWEFDTRLVEDGPHELVFQAVGTDGLLSEPVRLRVMVSNAAPVVAEPDVRAESPAAGALVATLAAALLARRRPL